MKEASSDLIEVRAHAQPFLHALFGDWQQHLLAGFIEVRIIGPHGVQSRFFRSVEAVLDALSQFKAANDARSNIYVGVNPRYRERGCEDDVQHIVALHLDVDKEDSPSATELAKRAGVEASMVVQSGHGLHLYWLLRNAVDLADDTIRARLRGINAAIAAAFGGDRTCYDLGRVLRIPGFKNVKDPKEPRLVQLVSENPNRRFTLNDFDFLHPAPLPSVKSLSSPDTSNDPPNISERLDIILESDPDVRRRFDGDPQGLNDNTASGIDLSLASLLWHRGCNFEEFTAAVKFASYNRDRQTELTPSYLARTWTKTKSGKKSEPVSATIGSALAVEPVQVTGAETPQEDGAALVRDIENFICHYVVLPGHAHLPLALWTLATHCFEIFDSFPYLLVTSPTPRCGKTRLLEVLELIVANSRRTGNISEAALFRLVAKDHPVLMLDEAESLDGKSDRAEALRALLNAGHRRGAVATRCGGARGDRIETFDVFCPKVIAGISDFPPTLRDRAIVIAMQRRSVSEQVGRFIFRTSSEEGKVLRDRAARFTAQNKTALERVYTAALELPLLEDREAESWAPLFTILSVADPPRADELHADAQALANGKADLENEQTLALRLLSDVRDVLLPDETAIATHELISRLRRCEESPWYTPGERDVPEQKLSPRRVARLLRGFGLTPVVIRMAEGTPRGYRRADLTPVFARYLQGESATSATSLSNQQVTRNLDVQQGTNVAGAKPGLSTCLFNEVADVAGKTSGNEVTRDGDR